MNIKIVQTVSLLFVLMLQLNACAFAPKSIPDTTHHNENCELFSSEWTIDVVPLNAPGHICHSEGCAVVVLAVPVVTAAIAISIALIGNSIQMIEEQFSCN